GSAGHVSITNTCPTALSTNPIPSVPMSRKPCRRWATNCITSVAITAICRRFYGTKPLTTSALRPTRAVLAVRWYGRRHDRFLSEKSAGHAADAHSPDVDPDAGRAGVTAPPATARSRADRRGGAVAGTDQLASGCRPAAGALRG